MTIEEMDQLLIEWRHLNNLVAEHYEEATRYRTSCKCYGEQHEYDKALEMAEKSAEELFKAEILLTRSCEIRDLLMPLAED